MICFGQPLGVKIISRAAQQKTGAKNVKGSERRSPGPGRGQGSTQLRAQRCHRRCQRYGEKSPSINPATASAAARPGDPPPLCIVPRARAAGPGGRAGRGKGRPRRGPGSPRQAAVATWRWAPRVASWRGRPTRAGRAGLQAPPPCLASASRGGRGRTSSRVPAPCPRASPHHRGRDRRPPLRGLQLPQRPAAHFLHPCACVSRPRGTSHAGGRLDFRFRRASLWSLRLAAEPCASAILSVCGRRAGGERAAAAGTGGPRRLRRSSWGPAAGAEGGGNGGEAPPRLPRPPPHPPPRCGHGVG